jgi:hypothetical protein
VLNLPTSKGEDLMQGACERCEPKKCCFFSRKGVKFGMAFGIPNAIFLLALGWAGWLFGYGTAAIEQTAVLYHGYGASLVGGLIGALWGFGLGFIYGYIFGLVVKCFSKCCCKPSACSK